MTRSCPTSALTRLDLPTFGRPSTATRIASEPISGGPSPGRSETTRSSRSPVPCPWSAEIGSGSPSPSRWNSRASSSRLGSSTLFATTRTGLPERRRMSATSSSPGVTPALASTTRRTRSAAPTARPACSATCCVSGEGSAMSTPPVSTRTKRLPAHSQTTSLRSRVTPGVSKTTASRVAVRRLTRVDLPTLGKPTTATPPRRGGSVIGAALRAALLRDLRGDVLAARIRLVDPDEPLPQPRDLGHELLGRGRVALGVARMLCEAHRLAEGDRHLGAVAELPFLGAVDRGWDHRHALADRHHRGARHGLPRHTALLARALDEEAEELVVPHGLAHPTERLAVGLAAPDRERSVGLDELGQAGVVEELALSDEDDPAGTDSPEDRDVDEVEVIHGENAPALPRDPLPPVDADRRRRARHVPEDGPPDHHVDDVDGLHALARVSTSRSIRSRTSSILSSVVSICSASGAACI